MYYELAVKLPTDRMNAMMALIDTAISQAKEKGMTDSEVMELRLAPDMFPFSKQIQIISDNGKGMAARLGGKENPKYDDNETTLPELKARLQKTVDFLGTFTSADFVGAEKREARFPYFPDMHMVGADYLLGYAIPNFFFHLTTAYDILRHYEFQIGKQDFMLSLPLIPDTL